MNLKSIFQPQTVISMEQLRLMKKTKRVFRMVTVAVLNLKTSTTVMRQPYQK